MRATVGSWGSSERVLCSPKITYFTHSPGKSAGVRAIMIERDGSRHCDGVEECELGACTRCRGRIAADHPLPLDEPRRWSSGESAGSRWEKVAAKCAH